MDSECGYREFLSAYKIDDFADETNLPDDRPNKRLRIGTNGEQDGSGGDRA